jgi:hypothetical protein
MIQFYEQKQKYRRIWMAVWILNVVVTGPFAQHNVFNLLALLWAVAAFSWLYSRYVLTADMLHDLATGRMKLRTVSKDDI